MSRGCPKSPKERRVTTISGGYSSILCIHLGVIGFEKPLFGQPLSFAGCGLIRPGIGYGLENATQSTTFQDTQSRLSSTDNLKKAHNNCLNIQDSCCKRWASFMLIHILTLARRQARIDKACLMITSQLRLFAQPFVPPIITPFPFQLPPCPNELFNEIIKSLYRFER
jgi:hypothetical protein